MKKLLIATLFAVFTLSANAQTEEVVENKSEITTTIHLNFETSIKKIEDVYSVKKLLYNVRKNRETNLKSLDFEYGIKVEVHHAGQCDVLLLEF